MTQVIILPTKSHNNFGMAVLPGLAQPSTGWVNPKATSRVARLKTLKDGSIHNACENRDCKTLKHMSIMNYATTNKPVSVPEALILPPLNQLILPWCISQSITCSNSLNQSSLLLARSPQKASGFLRLSWYKAAWSGDTEESCRG